MEKSIKYDAVPVDTNIKETIPFVLENDVQIDIKRNLSLSETVEFIQGVLSSLHDEETGEYYDEMKSFVIRSSFVIYYTNLELPEDISEQYGFIISHHNMINEMIDSIDQNQWMDLLNSILIKENIIKEKIIRQNDEMDILVTGLGNIVYQINQILYDQSESFKDVDVKNIIENLGQQQLDQNGVIDKILEHTKDIKPNRETRRKISKSKKDGKVVPLKADE